ncbi:MAG TPA: DUF3429 domain-containing protein [Kineobactrum sp.]
MNVTARNLGFAGVLPFLLVALGVWFSSESQLRLFQQGFLVYSLAILCFLAGTLWGTALHRRGTEKLQRLLVSNTIVVIAAGCVVFAPAAIAAGFLALFYLFTLWYERRSGSHSGWYPAMRLQLTWLVVVLHIAYIAGLVVRGTP